MVPLPLKQLELPFIQNRSCLKIVCIYCHNIELVHWMSMELKEEALWDSQYPNCSTLTSTIVTIFAITIVYIQNHTRQTFLAASAKKLRVELPETEPSYHS